MVGSDTPEASARALCSIPTSARAAFNCVAVSNVGSPTDADEISERTVYLMSHTSYLISISCLKPQNFRGEISAKTLRVNNGYPSQDRCSRLAGFGGNIGDG
jgi:hypothetical protein